MGSREEKFVIPEHEWQARRLCRDESCIGVIGKDGRCKECGLPADSAEPPGRTAPDLVHADPVPNPSATDPLVSTADGPADDWDDRRLCSDGNCIGVIGADGCCKECGLPDSGKAT